MKDYLESFWEWLCRFTYDCTFIHICDGEDFIAIFDVNKKEQKLILEVKTQKLDITKVEHRCILQILIFQVISRIQNNIKEDISFKDRDHCIFVRYKYKRDVFNKNTQKNITEVYLDALYWIWGQITFANVNIRNQPPDIQEALNRHFPGEFN